MSLSDKSKNNKSDKKESGREKLSKGSSKSSSDKFMGSNSESKSKPISESKSKPIPVHKSKSAQNKSTKIEPVIYIRDPNMVLVVLHEKRKDILKLLLKREMNIQEIKKEIGLNPGTIKRHLQTLIEADIIFISNIKFNDYNIKMKYYRAKAEKFKIEFTLPDDI